MFYTLKKIFMSLKKTVNSQSFVTFYFSVILELLFFFSFWSGISIFGRVEKYILPWNKMFLVKLSLCDVVCDLKQIACIPIYCVSTLWVPSYNFWALLDVSDYLTLQTQEIVSVFFRLGNWGWEWLLFGGAHNWEVTEPSFNAVMAESKPYQTGGSWSVAEKAENPGIGTGLSCYSNISYVKCQFILKWTWCV